MGGESNRGFGCSRASLGSSALAVLLLALVVVLGAPAAAFARHHTRKPTQSLAPDSNSPANEPYVSACVLEPQTGTVIFDQDMHKPWPPASMTKMMLMLIVAEKLHNGSLKLSDQVTTSPLAAKMGGSQVYLKEGETFSLDDMMKAVVIHSANDATVAVAEYVGGSTEAFVNLMNQRAQQLGMKDTVYRSVHGLPPGPGQQPDMTSAYDSALLARELVKYPVVLGWAKTDVTSFRNGTFELRNTNHLVRTYPGCDGLKTGFYDKAGFNVTATAVRNGTRLIAVVMGSPRKNENFAAAATLLSQGFLNYYNYQVARKGSPAKVEVEVNGGAVGRFAPVWGANLSAFIKRGDEQRALTVSYQVAPTLTAPVKAGQQVGIGSVSVDGHPAGSAPLLAAHDIARASLLSRLISRL